MKSQSTSGHVLRAKQNSFLIISLAWCPTPPPGPDRVKGGTRRKRGGWGGKYEKLKEEGRTG